MPSGKYFMIRTVLNTSLVLDSQASGTSPGTRVHTWEAHGGDNQQWYQDNVTGTIRNKLSDLCMDAGGKLMVQSTWGDADQQSRYQNLQPTISILMQET